MAVVVGKELLQDMMLIVRDPFEQSFVGVLGELGRSRVTVAVQAEPNTSTDECFDALLVGGGGEPPTGWGDIDQLGHEDYCSVYVFQLVVTHTVTVKNSNSIQRLSTLANNVTDMFTDG